jgi:hypothetical protein
LVGSSGSGGADGGTRAWRATQHAPQQRQQQQQQQQHRRSRTSKLRVQAVNYDPENLFKGVAPKEGIIERRLMAKEMGKDQKFAAAVAMAQVCVCVSCVLCMLRRWCHMLCGVCRRLVGSQRVCKQQRRQQQGPGGSAGGARPSCVWGVSRLDPACHIALVAAARHAPRPVRLRPSPPSSSAALRMRTARRCCCAASRAARRPTTSS